MERLGQYILSVTAAAILFSILQTLLGNKGSSAALVRLIGGLFLAFTVIAPVADIDFDALFDVPLDYQEQGSAAAVYGQQITQEEMASIIKQKCEAYILDKAKAYQTQLEVEVTLSQDEIPVPCSVRLLGNASPYAKASLRQWLQEDMGIRKENQLWIG